MARTADAPVAAPRPWESWPEPEVVEASVKSLLAEWDGGSGRNRIKLVDESTGDDVGYPSVGGLAEIGTRVGLPMDFVQKLSGPLQAQVITERLRNAEEQKFSLVREPYDRTGAGDWSERMLVTNIAPAWRGVAPHRRVAEAAWDVVAGTFGEANVEVDAVQRTDNAMRLRLMTPLEDGVTRRVGDVLRAGVEIVHRYGMELSARLFAKRLVCLNGMTVEVTGYDWKQRAMGTADMQVAWVTVGVADALGSFDELVGRARQMAETPVRGNPESVLIERARAMRIPGRLDHHLLAAFREEPYADEWHMLNAITRVATHSDSVPVGLRRRMQEAAGRWASGFDMVTASLPRPLANAVGAAIQEEGGDAED